MKKKLAAVILLLMLLLSTTVVFAAKVTDSLADAGNFFKDLFHKYPTYWVFFDSIIFFIMWMALTMASFSKFFSQDLSRQKIALCFALSAAFTGGLVFLEKEFLDKGLLNFSGWISAVILLILFMLGLLYVIRHKAPAATVGYLTALWYIAFYSILYSIPTVGDFIENNLGGIDLVLSLLYFAAWIILLFGIGHLIVHLVSGVRGQRRPQTVEEEEREALRKDLREARKDEKNAMRSLKREASKIKEAKDILAGLISAIAQGDRKKLSGRRWAEGQIAKLKRLEVGIGGYVGLIGILAQKTVDIEVKEINNQNVRDNLKRLKNAILAENKVISEGIQHLAVFVQVDNPNWSEISRRAKFVDDAYSKLLEYTNGVVAMERQIVYYLSKTYERKQAAAAAAT